MNESDILLSYPDIEYDSVADSHLLISACESFAGTSSSIDSPNYPFRYPNNDRCQNSIRATYGNRITLNMEHFDLERSENCMKDSLKIYEGSISNSTLASTRCGNDTTRYVSKSNLIYLVFRSDASISRTGYRIQYKSMLL